MIDLAARCVEEFGEAEGAQIVALAEFLQQQSAHPAQPVAKLRVASEDIAKLNLHKRLAHKATSQTVLASVSPDDPEFQSVGCDVVAGLVGIAPKTPVEAMLATQMIGMHNAVADSLRLARELSGRFVACTSTTPTGCREPSPDSSRVSSGSATRAVRLWSSSTSIRRTGGRPCLHEVPDAGALTLGEGKRR